MLDFIAYLISCALDYHRIQREVENEALTALLQASHVDALREDAIKRAAIRRELVRWRQTSSPEAWHASILAHAQRLDRDRAARAVLLSPVEAS